ncbi:MAG: hypothetical protein ACREBB_11865 [Nitrosotalea sp.]
MDYDEIRLSILRQFYSAMYDGEHSVNVRNNPELKDVPEPVVTANLVYLYDKGLINGEKRYADNGRVVVFSADITARGMDIVEMIVKQSLDRLEPPVIAKINEETTTPKKLEKLNEICKQYSAVFDVVIKVVGMIFSNLR